MAVQASRVTVGAVAVQLAEARAAYYAVSLVNRGTLSIFIGGSSAVTATTGYEVAIGDALAAELGPGEEIWGIAVADQRVDVLKNQVYR